MKILFLTAVGIDDLSVRGIYTDLIRYFALQGHDVYIMSPKERRYKVPTNLKIQQGVHILNIKTLNIQKTNLLEKGLATVMLENQFLKAFKKYFGNIKFDLILYSTPPITFSKLVRYVKERDRAFSYLLLKDIFPQNAVDLNFIKANGFLHRYFRRKETELYRVSDCIGCMSPANVSYVAKNNSEVSTTKLEVNPNSLTPVDMSITPLQKEKIRKKYNIPSQAVVFIYGGNLGKPQGLDFLLTILLEYKNVKQVFFLIVGNGTESTKITNAIAKDDISNAQLIQSLPKNEYDILLSSCDIGLIFLDSRFTIPNFPSRLLSYLECKMPVIAATDTNTDIGIMIDANHFGKWVVSGQLKHFKEIADELITNPSLRQQFGWNGYQYMMDNYLVENSYNIIMKHFSDV